MAAAAAAGMNCMCQARLPKMSDEEHPPNFDALREAVTSALRNRGILGKYKAELRKSIFDVLNEPSDPSKPVFKEVCGGRRLRANVVQPKARHWKPGQVT